MRLRNHGGTIDFDSKLEPRASLENEYNESLDLLGDSDGILDLVSLEDE